MNVIRARGESWGVRERPCISWPTVTQLVTQSNVLGRGWSEVTPRSRVRYSLVKMSASSCLGWWHSVGDAFEGGAICVRQVSPFLATSTPYGGAYAFLDWTALGRQEDWEEPKGRAAIVRGPNPDFAV